MNSRSLQLRHILALLACGLVAVMLGLMIWVPHPDFTWHDQQRLGQIAISVLAFSGILLLRPSSVMRANPFWLWPAVGVLVLGALSASLALRPLWAASEVALLASLAGGHGSPVLCLIFRRDGSCGPLLRSLDPAQRIFQHAL
jgi:hypothetical protein